jgi:cysteine synthase B
MALDLAEKNPSYYMPYQYGNPANPAAHYNGTAPEIHEQLGNITAFVAGLGTGGTLMGNARYFKEHETGTQIVAAEPLQGELVQGLRSLDDGFIPPIIDLKLIDRKEEGIFAGVSSGAICSVAVRAAEKFDEGDVVFIIADDGWKYLSSGVYTKTIEELEADGSLESTLFW